MLNNNIGLALEILSIYLAYAYEHNLHNEIFKIKKIRKKIYYGDLDAIKYVLNCLSNIIKENCGKFAEDINYNIDDKYFSQMLSNSREYLLDSNNANEVPLAIIIGGQQGSGKTGLVSNSLKEVLTKDIVILDLDAYRGFCKNCFELIKNYPNMYAEITNRYVGKIMENLTNEIIKKKYNFIFEGTLGRSAYTLDLLLNSEVKYKIIVKIMAVCREESLLSIFERYIKSYKKIGLGRLTSIESHDETYNKFTERIKNIDEKKLIVEVYCKDSKTFESKLIYKTGYKDNIYKNAYVALIEGRKRNYDEYKKDFKIRLDNINSNMVVLNDNEKVISEIIKLNQLFSLII